MVNISTSAITGIRDPEREGFIASTLFSQGWNITLRALDFDDIWKRCQSVPTEKPTLILSTDLEGINQPQLRELKSEGFTIFLFTSDEPSTTTFSEAQAFPASSLELISAMRGSLRAPLIRTESDKNSPRARTIAIAAASNSSGCTVTAINVATELSLIGHRTLLVDAHALAPAISILLSQRGLRASAIHPKISENLWGMEISQEHIESDISSLHKARLEYDFIVIDLGVLRNIPLQLTGKRWESESFIWSSSFADELWLLSKSDQLSLDRLRTILRDLAQNSIKPAISTIYSMRPMGKKNSPADLSFEQSAASIKSKRSFQLPIDSRNVSRAESERCSLYEVNERSHLRRTIAEIAGQLSS